MGVNAQDQREPKIAVITDVDATEMERDQADAATARRSGAVDSLDQNTSESHDDADLLELSVAMR